MKKTKIGEIREIMGVKCILTKSPKKWAGACDDCVLRDEPEEKCGTAGWGCTPPENRSGVWARWLPVEEDDS